MKALYFDVETTGLSPQQNDIIQISGIIEKDGIEVDRFNLRAKPINTEKISAQALRVTGLTAAEVMQYPDANKTYNELTAIFGKHVNKFNKGDKLIPIGYNVGFDMSFLREFFMKQRDSYFGSFVSHQSLDVLSIARFWAYKSGTVLPNFKLTTLCEHFGIELDAHDAMNDIVATRELFYIFSGLVDFTETKK